MEGIEKDYETLRGALPKAEYQELDNDVLGQILRTFNNPASQAMPMATFSDVSTSTS